MGLFGNANSNANSVCRQLNEAGVPYEDLTCLYPSLKSFYAKWETEYDCVAGRDWMRSSPWVPVAAVLLYMAFIVWGQAAMKNSKPWNWRRLMVSSIMV
mmetsp:Transcript_25277/g.37815  ORF Transcript_25277/g.37815 Transcript_25277/m.37815 type:complete len:99 (-) Transcript_25277:49-345(-)